MAKRIITETDVLEAAAAGKGLCVSPEDCIITDQACERALELGVELDSVPACVAAAEATRPDGAEALLGLREQSLEQLVRQACETLRGKLPASTNAVQVEQLVRQAIGARLNTGAKAPVPPRHPEGVVFIEARAALAHGTGTVPATEGVLLAEVLGPPGEFGLAAGYLAWEGASFSRVVEAPELAIVIEGELQLTVGGQTMTGKPGDMIYLPKDVAAVYSASSKVKLACVNGVC